MTVQRPRLVALDLDETLLDRESHLTEPNRSALVRAMDLGVEIAVATGRAYDTIPQELRSFPGIRYAVTGNGAVIYDVTENRPIYRKTLPPAAAEAVPDLLRGLDLQYEVFVDGRAYAQADYLDHLDGYMMDGHRQSYVKATRQPVPDILAFIRDHLDELDSLAVIPRNMDIKRRATERLHTLDKVYITTSALRLIEVNHRDCTKAAGLRFLAELLDIPQAATAAFGNGDNDAEMLQWAGWGVSVAEGTELCREAADYVTGSYLEGGVAAAFRTLWNI